VPLVSILTPSLDQVRFVGDCIDSIQRQDHPDVEHIVVDGGSTDGTLDVLRAAEPRGVVTRVVPKSGQSKALNEALAASRGEIIGWLNTDDAYFGVDTISSVVAAFEAHPEAVVVYGDAAIADDEGRVLRHVSTDEADLGRVQSHSPLVQPAVFFRRDAVADDFLREDLDLVMDYELWLRLRKHGPFVKVPRILAVDRDYAGRKTRERVTQTRKEMEFIAQLHGVPTDARASLHRKAAHAVRRGLGVRPMLTLESQYSFAYPARVDARWRRLLRQVALPQSRLSSQ
jgi:glycosyltransferase involved in cell wall biosynthesis